MRQKTVITKLLQSVTEVYYKVPQVLQNAAVITKGDVTPSSTYSKMIARQKTMFLHTLKGKVVERCCFTNMNYLCCNN